MRTACLGHGLVGEEVELEAFAQQFVGDFADAALPGGAGVGDDDVDAAEGLAHEAKARRDLIGPGHVAFEPEALDRLGRGLGRVAANIENGDRGAFGRKRLRRRRTDGAGAGDERDLPGQRLDHGAFQLGLLQAPIVEREQIALRQRLVAADAFGVGDDSNGVLGEIGGDAPRPWRCADAERPSPGTSTTRGAESSLVLVLPAWSFSRAK